MKIKKANQVQLTFGDKIDITDPCYNKDVWCRMTVDAPAGEYLGTAFIGTEGEIKGRVTGLMIQKKEVKDNTISWTAIGEIGVDSGLAGFFDNKPDFDHDEWINTFCSQINFEHKSWKGEFEGRAAFFSESGFGDGCYIVYRGTDEKCNVVGFMIDFEE